MPQRLTVTTLLAALLTLAACDRKPTTPPTPTPPAPEVTPEAPASEAAPGAAATATPPINVGADDWPWWRGQSINGIAPPHATAVTEWSETTNIAWKAEVPGRGHASPIVVGDRVIVATCDESLGTQWLVCYDRNDGSQRWATKVHEGKLPVINRKNSHASLTPACDGTRIYAQFIIDDGLWIDAVDLDGKIVWQKRVSDYKSEHGHGASPLIYKDMLIVNGEDMTGGWIAGLRRANGDVVWSAPRTKADIHANYATPVVGSVAGRDQLVLHGYEKITSYDPATGAILWHVDGPTEVCGNTPLLGKDHVYASGGYPRKKLLAIRADGTGDVTKSHVEWTDGKGVAYVPSSVLHNDRLYVVNDAGIASCYNATTGQNLWRERLGGNFTASLVLIGDKLYIPNESGTTFVFKAADAFEMVAENQLPEGTLATPAVSHDSIILRTGKTLYRIAPNAAE